MRPLALAVALLGLAVSATSANAGDPKEEGFQSLFDGKTLNGWDGDPNFWSVQDGALTGQTTKENPTKGNTFLIYEKPIADFELRLEYKIVGGNSGIQYRSFRLKNGADKWRIGGYQADIDSKTTYSGIVYGEKARGILAKRGEQVHITAEGKKKVVEQFAKPDAIQAKIKNEDWNSYRIVAKGNHLVQYINDVKTAELTDDDKMAEGKQMRKGLLALQLHAGPPMTVQFRNVRIKHMEPRDSARIQLPSDDVVIVDGKKTTTEQLGKALQGLPKKSTILIEAVPTIRTATVQKVIAACQKLGYERYALKAARPISATTKKVVFIAGTKSHGYGAHEHKAGCMLLAEALNKSGLPVETDVVTNGWPKDESVLDDADSIVIYCDGGGRHPFNAHIEKIDALMKKGVGLVCIHYAVEVPKGKSGEAFLNWTGGYFETNWSVNPHWTATFEKFAKHPITSGVKPFTINDEWYYHMRFRENMEAVTPILSDLPPKSSLTRKDGPHSNNPSVRAAVLDRKEAQHTAWAMHRKDGGRGFGFTGGHNHWNWGNNQFRKLVLNAIAWTAKVEVPKNGVPSKVLTVKDLMANQDYEPRDNFNPARIQSMLDQWNKQ